jgi:hypothetical protein
MMPSAVILFAGSGLHAAAQIATMAVNEKTKRLCIFETSFRVLYLIDGRP